MYVINNEFSTLTFKFNLLTLEQFQKDLFGFGHTDAITVKYVIMFQNPKTVWREIEQYVEK